MKTVILVRLHILSIIVVVMALGAYVLPQVAGCALLTVSTQSQGCCVEQAPGEALDESGGGASSLASFDEEDPAGDECLFGPELRLLSCGSEHPDFATPVFSSHVTDLSRRPPRLSVA